MKSQSVTCSCEHCYPLNLLVCALTHLLLSICNVLEGGRCHGGIILSTRDGHGRARAYEWGGADAQIVPAGPATDVMDDENDKVSQDVVAVPLGSGIHEFQWSQAWRSGLLCSALMSQLGGRASLVTRACQPNMPSSPYLSLSTLSPMDLKPSL